MLKVPLGATDETLYLSMLEASAKYFRIPKYQIYTEDELATLVHMKYEKMKGEPDYRDLSIYWQESGRRRT